MIINAVMCDYLRLTSYDPEDYKTMLNLFKIHTKQTNDKKEPAALMQYEGWKTSHGFLGTGKQKRGPHYLAHVSGQPAHIYYDWVKREDWREIRCTRLDVQLTIDLPANYSAPNLFDALEGKVPYGRAVTLYRSGKGMDTVYIGRLTTKHGRVTRIYVKEHGLGLALRFETQFNGDHADQHFAYLKEGGSLDSLLAAELESLGNIDFEPLSTFYQYVKDIIPAPRPYAVETSGPTLDWLLNTCDPAIRRMLNDHDHGSKVRRWLHGLLFDE